MGVVALSATVLAAAPVTAAGPSPGGGIRFEPVEPNAEGLTVAGIGSYRGAIEVRRNGGALAVVNEVGFEDYVRGIDEVPASWPAAALRAQAIAARTYAGHKVASREATPWRAVGADICATPRCQVYRGLEMERKAAGHGWLPAVEATAGQVLLSAGRPIMASYSATAAGPQAMSQNGALAMAEQGRSAGEILAAYYGMGPSQAAGRLPATIRVALATATGTVRVSASRPFRVVDEAGAEVATAVTGEWKVVRQGNGLGLVPPEGHTRPEEVEKVDAVVELARRPTRVISADLPLPAHGPWRAAATLLVLATGVATITVGRRRRA